MANVKSHISDKNILITTVLLLLCVFYSCNSSDDQDDYTPLLIETNTDSISLLQNSQVEVAIFDNDLNIPAVGSLSLTQPGNGSVSVVDINNTSQNLSDDIVIYIPTPNFVGSDVFQYTICDGNLENNCKTETVAVTVISASSVSFNLNEVPYATLSAYNFFEDSLKDLNPTFGVLPYDLNSALFSDYAKKKRFVWMPANVTAFYDQDHKPLHFPTGAVIIKNFYYENVLPNSDTRILETRLMYKTNEGWNFAKYVWNDAQLEAYLTNEGSFVDLSWMENNETKTVNYRIPSQAECFTCHNKFGTPLPIGPKPQNLNKDYGYNEGIFNQLEKWVEQGYLENNLPSNINSTVDWENNSLSLDLRARSYIDINCAHCHSEESYCEYRPMRFAFFENDDETNMGVCVTPDTQVAPFTKIIVPNNTDLSLMHFRMSTIDQQYRMPLLGRTLKHNEGVRLIEEWINSLTTECQ